MGTDRRPRRPRSLSVTADTYTHVLLDDRELDHALLLGELGKRV